MGDVPRVEDSAGVGDAFSLVFDRPDEPVAPVCIDIASGSDRDVACLSPRVVLLKQTVAATSGLTWDRSASAYDLAVSVRYAGATKSPGSLRMTALFQKTETNAANCSTGWRFNASAKLCEYSDALVVSVVEGSSGWRQTTKAVVLPSVPVGGVDRIALTLNGTVQATLLGVDAVSVKAKGSAVELVRNGGFDQGHRQTSFGDYAANFLDRLGGAAFWGSASHHGSSGFSLHDHGAQIRLFMWGRPLGDAVWFGEDLNSGTLIGDPLYNPLAVSIFPFADLYDRRVNSIRSLPASVKVKNGRWTASYRWSLCRGRTPKLCSEGNLWSQPSPWRTANGAKSGGLTIPVSMVAAGGEYWLKLEAKWTNGSVLGDVYGFTVKYTEDELSQAAYGRRSAMFKYANGTPAAGLSVKSSCAEGDVATSDYLGRAVFDNNTFPGAACMLSAANNGERFGLSFDGGATWVLEGAPAQFLGSAGVTVRAAASVVDGYIRDTKGQAIPSMVVTAKTLSGARLPGYTNLSGYYQIAMRSGDPVQSVVAGDSAYDYANFVEVQGSVFPRKDFILQPYASYYAAVFRDESGNPIKGADVSLTVYDCGRCVPWGITNENGYFLVTVEAGLPGAVFEMPEDYDVVSAPATVEVNKVSEYVLRKRPVSLDAAGMIAGFCTSAGMGAVEATVALYDATGGLVAQATPQASGFYKFKHLTPGDYRVVFQLDGAETPVVEKRVRVQDKAMLDINASFTVIATGVD